MKKIIKNIGQRLLDINLWPVILTLATGTAIILCGGYAIGLLPNLTPVNSAAVLFIEAALVIYWLKRKIYCLPPEERDPFSIMGTIATGSAIALITVVLCLLHFKWPKPASGAGAGINLVIVIIIIASVVPSIVSTIKGWHAARRSVQKKFA